MNSFNPNLNEETGRKLLDIYKRMESYQYFNIYAQTGLNTFSKNSLSDSNLKAYVNFCQIAEVINHPEAKIMNIEKDLIPIIEDTEASYKDLKLPYDFMFVNQEFALGDFIIKGFFLVNQNKLFEVTNILVNDTPNEIVLLFICANFKKGYEFYSLEGLGDDVKNPYYDMDEGEEKVMKKLAIKINEYASNIINLINFDRGDLEYIPQNYSKEENEKRIKRGKLPHKNTIILRLSSRLKRYAQLYNEARGSLKIRFLVRGHWVHYTDERYKNVKGQKKWIYPYYKGEKEAMLLHKKLIELKK